MDIVIPTLGRIRNQKTFNNLPSSLRENVNFVVQSHEYNEFCYVNGDKGVLKLPESIDNIADTRKWIHEKFKDKRYFVFDDDLDFLVKEPNPKGSPKWISRNMSEQDFYDMFDTINKWMDSGISHGSLGTTWVIPSLNLWPYADNSKIMTNVFYNGPKLPSNIQWNRVPYAEDFDVNLQLLTQGFANRISTKYLVSPSDTNSEGGCSSKRTIDEHNKSQRLLAKLWPDFVRLKEKVTKTGPWKGQIKLGTVIQHKRAYNASNSGS